MILNLASAVLFVLILGGSFAAEREVIGALDPTGDHPGARVELGLEPLPVPLLSSEA
jgi:hypothetical protein